MVKASQGLAGNVSIRIGKGDGDREVPAVEDGERAQAGGAEVGAAAGEAVPGESGNTVRRKSPNKLVAVQSWIPFSVNDALQRQARMQHLTKTDLIFYILCNHDKSIIVPLDTKKRVLRLAERMGKPEHVLVDTLIRNGLATLERMV